AAELRAVDATNAVVLGQPLIKESVVRVQQLEYAAVLAQDAFEKQFGLAPERLPQALVKNGEDVRVGRDAFEISEVQPLPAEVADEGLRARIVEHPADLLLQDKRTLQLSMFGLIQQLIVGDATPQKEREARGEFKIIQAVDRAGRGTDWI